MATTIISVKEKQGTFEKDGKVIDYHNFEIYGLNPFSTNEQVVAGGEVKVFKVKAPVFVEVLQRNFEALNNPNITKVQDIVGLYISPVFGEWGAKGGLDDFTLAVPESSPDKKKS